MALSDLHPALYRASVVRQCLQRGAADLLASTPFAGTHRRFGIMVDIRMLSHPFRPARLALAATLLLSLALAACSGTASSTPPPSGACVVADADNNVQLSAKDLKFSAPCIEAAAGAPIVIHFTNQEDMPHNVAVYADSTKNTELVKGDIINGPSKTTTVTVPAQQPGQLFYECSVHNSMNGALVVRAAPASSAAGY